MFRLISCIIILVAMLVWNMLDEQFVGLGYSLAVVPNLLKKKKRFIIYCIPFSFSADKGQKRSEWTFYNGDLPGQLRCNNFLAAWEQK